MATSVIQAEGFDLGTGVEWAGMTRPMPLLTRESAGATAGRPNTPIGSRWVQLSSAFLYAVAPSGRELFWKWDLYLHSLPSDGDGACTIFCASEYANADPSLHAILNSDGSIDLFDLYSSASVPVASSSAGVLATGAWYTVEVKAKQNTLTTGGPPYAVDTEFKVKIDGTEVASYTPASVSSRTYFHAAAATSSRIDGFFVGMTTDQSSATMPGTATDCYGVIDNVVVATTDWVGTTSRVQDIAPTGVGSNTGWGVTTSNDELACQDHPNTSATEYFSSTTAQDVVTFTMPTLQSIGINSNPRWVAVKIYQVSGVNFTGDAVLIVNGGTPTYTSATLYNGSYTTVIFSGATITPTDTVEIGIRKDNTATSRKFVRCLLTVETDDYTQPDIGTGVQVAYGQYTGNDTQQDIAVGFEPDVVIVTGPAGYSVVKMKSRTGYPSWVWEYGLGNSSVGRFIPRFLSNGFVVRGNTAATNSSSYDFYWIAIRDPLHRNLQRGYFPTWSGMDDVDIALEDSGFTAAGAIVQRCAETVNQTNGEFIRLEGHTGDQTNLLASTGAGGYQQANYIQALNAGSWEGGSGLYGSSQWVSWLAWRDTLWHGTSLWASFTYVGNGNPTQVVNLPAAMSAASVRACVIGAVAYPGESAYHSFTHVGMLTDVLGSHRLALSTMEASNYVTAFGVGTITVGPRHNQSGYTYSVWVMTDGEDTDATTYAEFPPHPGDPPAIPPWVVDWPDDLPGLLGIKFQIIKYDPGAVPADPWNYQVKCEQRQFPVDEEDFEHNVSCEQREFKALIGDSEGVE